MRELYCGCKGRERRFGRCLLDHLLPAEKTSVPVPEYSGVESDSGLKRRLGILSCDSPIFKDSKIYSRSEMDGFLASGHKVISDGVAVYKEKEV